MTLDLALELDLDEIRLLRRSDGVAAELGSLRFDDPRFGLRLAALRQEAGAREVEVVVPPSLVLFLDVGSADEDEVRELIEGETPCSIDDLVIGRSGHVAAAVERATLREARDFAETHGFHPTRYAARPGNGAAGQIFFGFEPAQPVTFRSHRAPDPVTPPAAEEQAPPDVVFRHHDGEEPRADLTDAPPEAPKLEAPEPRPSASARVSEDLGAETPDRRHAPPPARPVPVVPALTAPTIEPARNEADALTVFGARGELAPTRRGFSLLHIAAAALLAGVLFGAYELIRRDTDETEVVRLDEISDALADAPAETAVPPASSTDATDPGTEVAALDPAPAPVPPPSEPRPPAEPEAGASDAPRSDLATPVALPPPIEPDAEAQPAAPLPPESADAEGPGVFTPPPPPGTVFDMDERGLVRPTEEGAVTPKGVVVRSGPPEIRPPAAAVGLPGDAGSPSEAVAGDAAIAPDVSEPPDGPAAEALADVQEAAPPTPDPATVSAENALPSDEMLGEALADALEETTPEPPAAAPPDLPAPAPPDLPRTRPLARPETARPVVVALPATEDTPHPAPRPAAAEPPVEVAAAEPAEADFDALARQARSQTAAAGTGMATATPRAAEPPPPEPEGRANVAVEPSAPTRGSVAERATVENVLALNRVNLIGVYGTPSDRRALIRLPTGRYVKVKVGDRVDGGRVASIESSSVEYVKGGQRIALTLPKG